MIKYGKELFQDHFTQFMTIIVSLALAFVAKNMSGDIASMSLLPFIKEGYGWILHAEHLGIIRNVLIPFIMYLLSCAFLLWMGITNLVTYNEAGPKSEIILEVLVGFVQLLLFGILMLFEALLFSYFMLLVFTVIILIDILNYASSVHEVERETEIDSIGESVTSTS